MTEQPSAPFVGSRSPVTVSIGVAVTLLVAAIGNLELQRVENGRLFLFALPHESPPSDVERMDARETAAAYGLPAVGCLLWFGLLLVWFVPTFDTQKTQRAPTIALAVFATAVVADLLTTIRFFHTAGIEFEFHPAIRLLGYAYGRTVGPILGKGIQAAGVLIIARGLGPKRGSMLLVVVATVYLAAAIYNSLHA